MKKIALAIENFSRYGGGAESYAVSLADFLLQHGWEVHCYGERFDGEPAGAFFHPIQIPRFLPPWFKMLLFAYKHKNMVEQADFDVVLGFGNTILMNAYQSHGGVHWYSTKRKSYSEPSPLLRALKTALQALTPKQHVRDWIESAPFRIVPLPRIVAISAMLKRDFITRYHITPEQVDLVYNGIDTVRFSKESLAPNREPARKRLGIEADEVVFLFVSYELKKKGVEPLINAADQLKRKTPIRFRVVVVGAPPNKTIMRLMERLNLGSTILFTGPSKVVHEYYAAADAFLLPTYYDACSLAVLEAMVAGLPAITTETNGISGILTNGENGYVISHPPDATELSDRMLLLMDSRRRQEMSKAAMRLGLQYTKTKNHEAMLAICDAVAASHGKAAQRGAVA